MMPAMRMAGKLPDVFSEAGVPIPPAHALSLGGRIQIDAPFYQAGLAGYSDAAMRLTARRHGCPYCVTEAMLDRFLVAGGKPLKEAELEEADHPIAGQLMGSHPEDIAQGAEVLLKLGYDVIDVNLACPVKKIKKKCRGGHLLSVPEEAIAILEAVRNVVGDAVPLTVKLRQAYDDTPAMASAFDQIFETVLRLGYAGATVHCRTVEQKYLGPSRWSFLADLTRRYGLQRPSDGSPSDFLLGGSGDIWSAQDIFRMIEQTGVHWVSVARGCIGNPWIFEQARSLMAGGPVLSPTIHQQRAVLLEHFEWSVRLHGEAAAGRMMRKFGIRFSRHHPMALAIRARFIAVKSLADWEAVLKDYYQEDGPGVAVEEALPEEAEAAQADCGID